MNKVKLTIIVLSLVFVSGLLINQVPAQNCPHKAKHQESKEHYSKCCSSYQSKGMTTQFWKMTHFMLDNKSELELTAEQEKKLSTLMTETGEGLTKRSVEIDKLGMDIQEKIVEEKIDIQSTKELIGQKYDLKKARSAYLVEALANAKSVLLSDQMVKFQKLYNKALSDKASCCGGHKHKSGCKHAEGVGHSDKHKSGCKHAEGVGHSNKDKSGCKHAKEHSTCKGKSSH